VQGLKAFVIAGTLIALFYLGRFAVNPDVLSESAVEIREAVGRGYSAPTLALIILFAYFRNWSEGLRMPRWIAVSCFLVCLLATVLSLSRTNLIMSCVGA